MTIYPFEKQDLLSVAAFQQEGWNAIVPVFEYYVKTDFCFPICVKIDNEVVGIGSMILHDKVAWLGHIITHQNHRKKGIGQLVTETLVKNAQEKGCNSIQLIATDMGAPVYEKVGFVTQTAYLFFKNLKANPTWVIDPKIVDYQEKYRAQLQLLDLEISAENRFAHLKFYLDKAKVYIDNNVLLGYYLPTFGDGLIVAKDANVGIALAKLHLQHKDTLIYPQENLALTTFLHQENFQEFRAAKRMQLGNPIPWKPACVYNRIGGNLG